MTLQELIDKMTATLAADDFFLKPTEEDVALLESMLPEERKGECFCDDVNLSWKWKSRLGAWVSHSQSIRNGFCGRCGAELGADGIARCNADTRRLQILAVMESEGWAYGGDITRLRKALDEAGEMFADLEEHLVRIGEQSP